MLTNNLARQINIYFKMFIRFFVGKGAGGGDYQTQNRKNYPEVNNNNNQE